MRRVFFIQFLFVLFLSSVAVCQGTNTVDSLLKNISKAAGKKKVNMLNDLADSYLRTSAEKTIEYAEQAIKLSDQINYQKGRGDAYNLIGIADFYQGQFADALTNYKAALKIRETLNDKKGIASSLSNIGLLYNSLGNYEKSLEYGLKALKAREELGDKYAIGASVLNVGIVYYHIDDFNSALKYFNQALDIMQTIKKDKAALVILNDIGSVYRKKKIYNRALEFYNRAIKLSITLDDKKGTADGYQNIANLNWDMRNYSTALYYYNKSLPIYEFLDDKYSIANILNNIAVTYQELKQFDKMKPYLDRAIKLSKAIDAKPLIQDNYQYTSEYYEGKNNFRAALKYYQLYSGVKDTILNEQNTNQIEELKTKYETEKKEQEILQLQQERQLQDKEIEVQRIWRASLIGGLILIFLLLAATYNRYLLKKKSNDKIRQQNIILETLNNEKNMFLGIAAHDLKNPLTSIMLDSATVKLMYEKNKSTEIPRKMTEIESTAKRMKDIISRLLDLNRIETGKIELEMTEFDIVLLLKAITDKYRQQAETKKICMHFIPSKEFIRIKSDRSVIAQILDNLISNAIKFSEEERNVFINVDLKDGKTIISVKDEGPGFSEDELPNLFKKFVRFSSKPTAGESTTGLGLSIAKSLTEVLQGNIWCESAKGKGSSFIVELPV